MKKLAGMMLIGLLVLSMMTGAMAQEHTHAAGEEWNRDAMQHWLECECGERMEAAAHVMDEEYTTLCTVCGSDIWVFEGIYVDIMNYDEYGSVTRYTSLDGEGNMLSDFFYRYDYDEEGNVLYSATFAFDRVSEEVYYAPGAFGEYLARSQRGYFEDGSSFVVEYDEYGNPVSSAHYDENGELFMEESIRYEYDEAGNILCSERNERYADGSGYDYLNDQYGNATKEIYYNESGAVEFEIVSEYEYDEEGNMLYAGSYADGVLSSENFYVVLESEWGSYCCEQKYICYLDGGAKEVYEYDERGNVVREAMYNAEGIIEYEYRYEHEYDENDNLLKTQCFEGERLLKEEIYYVIDTDEQYVHYLRTIIEYAEDGIKSIETFNEYGDTVDFRRYDAEGNELEMRG